MADVVRRFGPAYLKSYGRTMPLAHKVAMESIAICRTPAAGGEVVRCSECRGEGYVFRSCRHRACPRCNRHKGDQWLKDRQDELLPVPYFHVVFTVPEVLRRTIRKHQRVLYPVLMQAAAETLKELAADPAHMGGRIGIMAAFHSWTRTLEYHPHVHCLVPAGYLDDEGQWHEVKRPYLAPHKALAEMFRGKLCRMMRDAVSGLQLPGSAFSTSWVVHVDLPKHGRDVVLRYLARYVNRGPMSESRLLNVNNKTVTFKYRDRTRLNWNTMVLKGREFLRRYLQHVTPKGFHRVRYYGLWSKALRPQLNALRDKLNAKTPAAAQAEQQPPPVKQRKCPVCDTGQLCVVGLFHRGDPLPQLRRPLAGSSLPVSLAHHALGVSTPLRAARQITNSAVPVPQSRPPPT